MADGKRSTSPTQMARSILRRLSGISIHRKGIFPETADVVLRIFEHVAATSTADTLALARVCRSWRQLAFGVSVWRSINLPMSVPTKPRDVRQARAWNCDHETLAAVANHVRSGRLPRGVTTSLTFYAGLPEEEDLWPACWDNEKIKNAFMTVLAYVAPGLRKFEFEAGVAWQAEVVETLCAGATPGRLTEVTLSFRDATDECLATVTEETPAIQRKLALLHPFLPALETLRVDWPLDRLTVRELLTGERLAPEEVPQADRPENPFGYPYCFHVAPLAGPFVLPPTAVYPNLQSLRLADFSVSEGEEFSLTRYDTVYQLFATAFPGLKELELDARWRRHPGGFRTFPFVYLDVLLREDGEFIRFPGVERVVLARGKLEGDIKPVTEVKGLKDERSLVQPEGVKMVMRKFPAARSLEVRWREGVSRKLKVKRVNL
ncbi:hypothetical protein BC938DRAFT_482186 [Jimgerdemannia flammicorona]|uniref:F-box domain-containing protein n=1 Tax=Jimgerdemannia flammicorona TaxID=994334 RepID=A0A433QEI1_9FUNG|nr:hypothetical protein BC938DRAFT_482186 [Jimgerdemannia flammicorona]